LIARSSVAVASINPALSMAMVPEPGRSASLPLPLTTPVAALVMSIVAVGEVTLPKSSACPLSERMVPAFLTATVLFSTSDLMRKASSSAASVAPSLLSSVTLRVVLLPAVSMPRSPVERIVPWLRW
jgi:hypothetical protein